MRTVKHKHLAVEAAAFLCWLLFLVVAVPISFAWVLAEDLCKWVRRKYGWMLG